MMEYTSLDNSYEIKGRGTVFFVKNEKDRNMEELKGASVVIDGNRYTVKAVENMLLSTRLRVGEKIGLLVQTKNNTP